MKGMGMGVAATSLLSVGPSHAESRAALSNTLRPGSVDDVEGRKMEIRGVDIHPSHQFDKDVSEGMKQCKEVVDLLYRCNFNFLRPFVVITRCNANYNSKIVPIKNFSDWDPLEVMVEEAHSRGMEVHPFVCVIPQGKGETYKPGNLGPVLEQHPDWAMANKKGELIGWAEPLHPEFRKYAISIIEEIVGRYDVDGISVDYVRYPGRDSGYSEYSRKKFEEEFKVDPTDIAEGDPMEEKWDQWRIRNVDQLVGMIRSAIREIRSNVILSAYVWTPRDPHICLRDWLAWIEKGYLDAINPTGYLYDFEKYMERCRTSISAAKKVRKDIPAFINVGVHTSHGDLQNPAEVIKWTRGAREAGADGISYFALKAFMPWVEEVAKSVFPEKADLPWKRN